jgi:NarL family two-component system response regulator LiaR
MGKIRIFIVDDHPLMRQALEMAILTQDDMEIAGQAANGLLALRMLPQIQPDVVLIDLLMPKMDGLEAIPHILAAHPQARIVVVTGVEEEDQILQAVQAGVAGYLTKSAERDEIVAAIRAVVAGNSYFPSHITAKLLHTVRQGAIQPEKPEPTEPLTPREADVLALLGEGLSNQQIAEALHLAPSTVRFHMHRLMGKLGFENRSEAVAYAVKRRMEE